MTKLEQLRDMVAGMFANATKKEEIENLAKLNNSIDEVEKDQKELTEKNAELIKSYKELIKHTSFKGEPPADTQPATEVPSFDEALNKFLASQKDKE